MGGVIVGVNHSLHESSVVILDSDAALLFAQAEERLSREKYDSRFPKRALTTGLQQVGAATEDIHALGMSFPSAGRLLREAIRGIVRGRGAGSLRSPVSALSAYVRHRQKDYFVGRLGLEAPTWWFAHHPCHARAAAFTSGTSEAAILVVDGNGSRLSTSIWNLRGNVLEPVRRIEFPDSLGLLYSQVTGYLGFEPFGDEWKVMGLAPFGEPGVDLSPIVTVADGGYSVDGRALLGSGFDDYSALEVIAGPARRPDAEITDRDRNVAFAVQDVCERAMLQLARTAHRLTGADTLCIAGGVAMNCKANGRILAEGPFERVFVPPAASDEGASLGAAYGAALGIGVTPPNRELRDARLGTAWSNDAIEEILRNCGVRFERLTAPEAAAAEALAAGRVVARFVGRGEFGARALGARSILGNPASVATRDRINAAVKYREAWRPFAPMVMEERGAEYFEPFAPSPFMTLTFRATDRAKREAPAIVHEDGTARVQSVHRDDDPLLHLLLAEFAERTGTPILLNTSFNLKGEPIVYSPLDALRTFFSSGLEELYIESFRVTK